MISQDKIAEIRNRASIFEVISDYVTLKKSGRNYMGLCPFHGEKTPSFTVSEEKGIFHCFGCQAGGSVFQFLMQYDHLTFPESVERVAKRYGIALELRDRQGPAGESGERERLYRINERIALHYQKILFGHPEGKTALEYLQRRGLDDATVRKFMLGYAPQGGGGLMALGQKENISPQDMARLGLIGQRGGQQYYEKFFARVMFPISNPAGNVVAFGGRVLNQAMPKYLNSSETPLFHKGATLYGLFQAKDAVRKFDRVVVVEGYLDVIALAQHEISYTVATLGTALTVEHVRALSRYTKNVIALFDGDSAGQKAAARSFEIFVEGGLLGRAAFLPKEDDPDTFIRQRGKAALEEVLDRAVPMADYYFSWLAQRYGQTIEGKSQIAGELSRVLAKTSNAFEVDLLVGRAADRLGVREDSLRRQLAAPAVRTAAAHSAPPPLPNRARDGEDRAERSLISMMLRLASVVEKIAKDDDARGGFSPLWRPVVDGIIAEWHKHGNVDVSRLTQELPKELAAELTALALEGDRCTDAEGVKMAADCLSHLRRKSLKAQARHLRLAIRAAEEQRDENAKRERMLEWQDLVRKERQLDRPKREPKITAR